MFTSKNILMSLEELESLMDEQEMAKTMAITTATTTITAAAGAAATTGRNTAANSAIASTTTKILQSSHEKKLAAIAFTEPDAGQQAPAILTTTSSADDSQIAGTTDKHLEPCPNLGLWKIPVFITENREDHQKYAMETELPWTSQSNSSYNLTYFDDAGLANHVVRLSFDESSAFGAGFPRAIGMANSLDSSLTKPATPEIRPQRQRAKSSIHTTPSRKTFASPGQSHPDAGAKPSPATVHPVGGFREVITISFPTIKACSSGLQDLDAAKGARRDNMEFSIKRLFGEMQVEVSGPAGSNIRGFVMSVCSKRYGVSIKAAMK
ncbi:hypothetical protein OCU04_013135 [Sclerotinia nivalis]|uniref:Uncharacterized protein n=1 Tax=Sclerotinia nivalis TaxID=352851 RepID=A0A9X0DC49_9HELO|nr:hypothetical protein OCU04_013135 [Sclerotinia nivalis]